MDSTANAQPPFAAAGTKRISYAVPDSFFPINRDAPGAKSWTPCLAAPRLVTQLRAWSRVPLTSQTSRSFSGTIMKRVGLLKPKAAQNTLAKSRQKTAAPSHSADDMYYDSMPQRRIRQRLDTYMPTHEDASSAGEPPSKLDIAGLTMRAKADVAFCVNKYPTSRTREELRQSRAGHYVKTIPTKRRYNELFSTGNKLRTYREILDMPLHSQFHLDVPSLDAPAGAAPISSPIKASQSPFKSPVAIRSPLSQEPVTPASMMMPPDNLPSQSRSPTKRSPRHQSPPIKTDAATISPAVKLLPTGSPMVQPSPTKSASPPPSTPIHGTNHTVKVFDTPSTFPRAVQTGLAFTDMQRYSAIKQTSPLQLLPPTALVLASPCPANTTTESPSKQSPSKRAAPVAPTPTRQTRAVPATPEASMPTAASPDNDTSPICFLSKLFAQSPAPAQPFKMQISTPQVVPDFDFGAMSPSFNSVTWMHSAENPSEDRVRNLKSSSRRQSEPLVRNCLRSQARRQTLSPRKLVFKSNELFHDQDPLSLHPNRPELSAGETASKQDDSTVQESDETTQAETAMEAEQVTTAAKPAPEDNLKTPGSAQSATSEVLNIDMRQNPDIFGARPLSLDPSPVLAAGPLPSIVEDGTESEASIIHAEGGRLEVQFKVTPQFASLVPDSQGSPATSETASVADGNAASTTSPDLCAVVKSSPEYYNTKVNGLGIFDAILGSDSPVQSIEGSPEVSSSATQNYAAEHSSDEELISETPEKATEARETREVTLSQSPSPPLNLSFTAVNASQSKAATNAAQASLATSPEKTLVLDVTEAQSHDYDSPGRDYMREFIRRSKPKPKRLSTTEAGSPVAPVIKRQPLGAKSPNTESPIKAKRKLDEKDLHESPIKKLSAKPDPKKMRRYGMGLKKRIISRERREGDNDRIDVEAPSEVLAQSDDLEDDADLDGASSRRSSRIKSQAVTAPLSRSAIPTPIKIGRSTGATLNSSVRSEQQELTNQTRMNTRKNKGSSEYPAQFLARQSEEVQSDDDADAENFVQTAPDGTRKCVAWKSPLAAYQEEEHEKLKKKGSKTTKTVRTTGIAKPLTRAKTTADKERTARLAEHFGMVSNGTPAKPQRVTRSRMQT